MYVVIVAALCFYRLEVCYSWDMEYNVDFVFWLFHFPVNAERGESNLALALHRWEDMVFDLNAKTSNQMLVSWLLMCEWVERCSHLG